MDKTYHHMTDLFAQLGLSSESDDMSCFLAENSPLDAAIRLEEAPFWTNSQAALLHEKILLDADWAVVVDQLNLALREPVRIQNRPL